MCGWTPRRTSADLKGNCAVISSCLAGAQPVSFALFSAIKARKFQARLFVRGSWRVLWPSGELVLTQADQRLIKGHRCGDF